MTPKETIIKHIDFVRAVATLGSTPQRDNVILKEVVDAWIQLLKDLNSKVVVGDCGSCNGGWISAVKDFYVYAKKENWI